jgi:hypothetical protein
MLLVVVNIFEKLFYLKKNKQWFYIYLDNQLIETISQTQNRAAKDKKTSSIEVQSLWTPLTQLGEQLTLALVFYSKSLKIDYRFFFRNYQINENKKDLYYMNIVHKILIMKIHLLDEIVVVQVVH